MDPFLQASFSYKYRSMARLHAMAKVVLKEDHIVEWFSHPHELLGGKSAFELTFSDEGYDRVEQLLASMAYGFPS